MLTIVISDNIRPIILRKFVVAVLFSVLCHLVSGPASAMTQASGRQQASNLGQQGATAAPEAGKASQDAQTAVQEPKGAADSAKKDAAKAAEGGIALKATTNVKDYVDIQVVLLPRKQAKRVFSKEIASHYAVMQVLIDNRSEDAAFVLHSIFADYAGWALGGVPSAAQLTSALTVTGGSSSSAGPCPQEPDNVKAAAYQTVSCAGQVASIESRVIRGELQDASTWTVRNTLIRAAVLVGAVASGIPAFGSKDAVKYVGAYNGQFVPGMEVFLPDSTVTQINRVSDFGFQTNKVFGKGLSDPIYAFFPLDRFLTPGMKNIFLNAPAVFFAPAQIFVDKHFGKLQSQVDEMKNLIEDLVPAISPLCDENNAVTPCLTQKQRDQKMLRLLTKSCSKTGYTTTGVKTHETKINKAKTGDTETEDVNCDDAQAAQHMINQISLNSANILVQGVMTVNVAIVPATITDITFDEGNDSLDVWTVTGKDHAATMTGSFLTGGVPEVTSVDLPTGKNEKGDKYIEAISVVSEGSSDTKLQFKLQLKDKIDSGSKLHFQVTKYDPKDIKKTSGVKSMDFVFPVNYVPKASSSSDKPSISKVIPDNEDKAATWKSGSTLTGNITGSGLDNTTPEVVKLTLKNGTSTDLAQYIDSTTVDASKPNDGSNLHFTLKVKTKDVPAGSKLTFKVTKNTAAGADKAQALESNTYDYPVNYK